MGMITANPLFLIKKISNTTRTFIAVSIIAGYGLFLYEMLPEYLFIPMSAILYFGLPTIVILAILVLLPKLLLKGSQQTTPTGTGLTDGSSATSRNNLS